MVFIIMFDRLVITDYLTSGFCWSSGSDINSSIESEPDLSRSWGFLRDYFFADSSNKHCDSLEIDIPILKKEGISARKECSHQASKPPHLGIVGIKTSSPFLAWDVPFLALEYGHF